MTIEPHLDLDGSMSRRFGTVADEAQVKLTAAALEANGTSVLRAADAAKAQSAVGQTTDPKTIEGGTK